MNLYLLQPGDQHFWGGSPGTNSDGNLGDRLGAVWHGPLPIGANQANVPCMTLLSAQQAITSNNATQSLSPITCSKAVSIISPMLYDACLRANPLGRGKDQPTLLWIASKAADNSAHLLCLQLRDAIVGDVTLQGAPDGVPTEAFQFTYTEVLWTASAQNNVGKSFGNISAGWSSIVNKPIGQFTD